MVLVTTVMLLTVLGLAFPCFARDTDDIRGYLGVRLGLSAAPDTDVGGGLGLTANEQVLGVTLGVNLGRHLGVEIAGDGWERNMRFGGRTIGEFAMYTVMPYVRLRYPVLEGRVSPYALAGLGIAYTEFNDRKPPAFGVDVGGVDWGVAGAVGVGIEFFVANNVAVGFETKYIVSRDQHLRFNGGRQSLDLDTFLMTGGIRILFPETKSR
jgi:opacity protein-like surface antigen